MMNITSDIRDAVSYIDTMIATLPEPLQQVCQQVTLDPWFAVAPAAKGHHHAYTGGLAVHTAEVLQGCMERCKMQDDRDALIAAAVWHDYLKIVEYEFVAITETRPNGIGTRPGSYPAEHVTDKAWRAAATNVDTRTVDAVAHCILAHHCKKEWGSPEQPRTMEAYILHTADMYSSRYGEGI